MAKNMPGSLPGLSGNKILINAHKQTWVRLGLFLHLTDKNTAGQRSCELPQVTKLGSRRATFDLRSSGSKSTRSSFHHTAPGGFTRCFIHTAKDPPVSGFLISKSHEKISLTVGRWFILKMV